MTGGAVGFLVVVFVLIGGGGKSDTKLTDPAAHRQGAVAHR